MSQGTSHLRLEAPLAIDEETEAASRVLAALEGEVATPAEAPAVIDPLQILRDRPDVFAAFYREFYGPNNDRHSPAWVDRVGGETPEDFARYWYETYGRYEGYTPSVRAAAAPAEDAPVGRTTIDGIALSKILSDRPDVFQAYFTAYYGPDNDRNSDAWVKRVGGTTIEDFANYWYNAHGRVEGYRPSVERPAAEPEPEAAPEPDPVEAGPPLDSHDPALDPWNHPAIFPDWQPPYPGWVPPDAEAPTPDPLTPVAAEDDYPFARPLIVTYTDEGIVVITPATLQQISAMQSLFDDTVI